MNDYTVIEFCNKETDEVVEQATKEVLSEPLSLLKERMDDFLYVESPRFDALRMDCATIECDDVFETSTVLFGLRVPLAEKDRLDAYCDKTLKDVTPRYGFLYSDEERLFDVNVTCEALPHVKEGATIGETLEAFIDWLTRYFERVDV